MANIRDIAKLAGVSIGTVSKALHDNPRLKPETRRHIQQLAEELGYYPNQLAHAVLTKQSRSIGLLLADIERPYDASILSGVMEEAMSADYHVLVREHKLHPDRLKIALTFFVKQRVEGIICAPYFLSPGLLEALTFLRGQEILVVGTDIHTERALIDNVGTDLEHMAALAVDYLMGLGHRQIALLGGMPNVPLSTTLGGAVLQALRKHHLVPRQYGNQPSEAYDEAYTISVLKHLRHDHPAPTALICWTDINAARVIIHGRALGLRIPEDLSLLACCDSIMMTYTSPAITCIDIAPREKGCAAVRHLFRLLERTPPLTEPASIVVPCQLVVRQSCRKPSAAW